VPDLTLDLKRLAPYLADIRLASGLMGEDPALLAAIMLRETAAGWGSGYVPQNDPNGTGDHGHGRGLMQIDDRGPYAKFLPADPARPWPVLAQCQVACVVLADARATMRPWRREPAFSHAYVAAYNAGAPRVAECLRHGLDPDSVTTGKDYSAWVWRKRDALMKAAPDSFTLKPPAGPA
jgi:hypothetical protein